MRRHAHPWTLWRIFLDQSERTHPGRHAARTSPTHQPAWPFTRNAA